jgi:hypothetical protein
MATSLAVVHPWSLQRGRSRLRVHIIAERAEMRDAGLRIEDQNEQETVVLMKVQERMFIYMCIYPASIPRINHSILIEAPTE